MTWTRVVVLVLALGVHAGCTGGGGSSSTTPSAAWAKFRQNVTNMGQGVGVVVRNAGFTPTPVAILWSTNIDNSRISASPAVGLNNIIFIGTEGGTLAALNSSNGTNAWPSYVTSCSACAPNSLELGPLISSPAVYTNNSNSQTSVFVGSANGAVFGFQFTGNDLPTCAFCFQPRNVVTQTTSFISSPSFTINLATSNVAGIFIGATITDAGGTSGKLYALNPDGSVKWVYPKSAPTTIAPISSSPAIGFGNTVYFTTDDGLLYALTASGDFLWKAELAGAAELPLAPSPVASLTRIIASSGNGVILALNADGSFNWGLSSEPNDGFVGSLAVGFPAQTPTPTPGAPTPVPLTPTLTPVPGTALTAVVAVRRSGSILLIDAATGRRLPVVPRPIAACPTPQANDRQVCSSPALSSDGYIVIGDHDGVLHAISTVDGTEPALWNWPITLVPNAQATPQPIRSSPALDGNGVAYVGSDDGYVYAVGTQ